MISYIVDDRDEDIEYLCPSNFHGNASGAFYSDTWTSIDSNQCEDGWFRYTFQGQGVNVVAGLSQITSQSYAIQLDSNVFNHLGDGGYESPILTDGEHAITYSTGDLSLFPVFDYLTVIAGAQTAMRGRNVIVDDQNTETAIDFVGGGWSTATLRLENVFDHGKGPYNDTIHWVSEANNSLSFAFTGSSVSLYAVLPPTTDGRMSLTYAVDGNFVETSVVANLDNRPRPMFALFGTAVAAGDHVLTVNVTSVTNTYAIGIDFITYTAAFDRIAELDNISASTTTPGSKHRTHAGAIAGGVVGGLAFVALVTLFLWIMKRRRTQQSKSRAAAVIIGRNYNPRLDVKVVPAPAREVYPMADVTSSAKQ